MKALFFSPAALGDMLVSIGIIKSLLSKYEEIVFPINKAFSSTLKSILFDEPRIKVIEHDETFSLSDYALRNGLHLIENPYQKLFLTYLNDKQCAIMWDEQFYTIFDVPFSQKYKTFSIPNLQTSHELKNKIVHNDRYILVHRNYAQYNGVLPIDMHYWRESAGLDPIEKFQIIDIDPSLSSNMMDYVELIRGAEEIHCVPSSFYILVDNMNHITKAKLFLHNIRKEAVNALRINNQHNNYRWVFINYDKTY